MKLRVAVLVALLLVSGAAGITAGQHCGCPASQWECSLPCSVCCAPVCTGITGASHECR